MRGRHHREFHAAQIDGAALVEAHGLHPFSFAPESHDVVLTHHWNIQLFRQRQDIDHMVEMHMGQDNVCRPCDGSVVLILGQARVAGQPWVQQQHLVAGFKTKTAVAQPDDLQGLSPNSLICLMSP